MVHPVVRIVTCDEVVYDLACIWATLLQFLHAEN